MIRIRGVQPMAGYTVCLFLTDGSRKIVDLEPYLRGPVFEALKKKPALFRTLKVCAELGTIVWDNGAYIDPDVLIKGMDAQWVAESTASKRRISRVTVVKEKGNQIYSPKKGEKEILKPGWTMS